MDSDVSGKGGGGGGVKVMEERKEVKSGRDDMWKENKEVGKQKKWLTADGGEGDFICETVKQCLQAAVSKASSRHLSRLHVSYSLAPPSKRSKSITLLQLRLLLFNTHLRRDICRYLLINGTLINTTSYSWQIAACGWIPALAAAPSGCFPVAERCSDASVWAPDTPGCSFACVFPRVRVGSINTRCWWWRLSN